MDISPAAEDPHVHSSAHETVENSHGRFQEPLTERLQGILVNRANPQTGLTPDVCFLPQLSKF